MDKHRPAAADKAHSCMYEQVLWCIDATAMLAARSGGTRLLSKLLAYMNSASLIEGDVVE